MGGLPLTSPAMKSRLSVTDGRCWGEVAQPFQWQDAFEMLDPIRATPCHVETRPRGGSKTADAAAVLTAAMVTQAPPVLGCTLSPPIGIKARSS